MIELSKLIPAIVGSFAIIGGVIGAGKVIDDRYAKHEELTRLAQDSEQARLETDLELAQQKLAFLRSKSALTAEEQDEVNYLVQRIAKIRERLAGLSKGEG